MDKFFRTIRNRIIWEKEAYLLHNLLEFIKKLSASCGIDSFIENTVVLKRKLSKKFEELIDFFPVAKYIIVHSSNINPCKYAVASLIGKGIRDKDHTMSFANFIKTKLQENVYDKLPSSSNELEMLISNRPMQELYNIIYTTNYGPS